MHLLAFTDGELNAFLDNTHTVVAGLMAGWLAYYLLTKHKRN